MDHVRSPMKTAALGSRVWGGHYLPLQDFPLQNSQQTPFLQLNFRYLSNTIRIEVAPCFREIDQVLNQKHQPVPVLAPPPVVRGTLVQPVMDADSDSALFPAAACHYSPRLVICLVHGLFARMDGLSLGSQLTSLFSKVQGNTLLSTEKYQTLLGCLWAMAEVAEESQGGAAQGRFVVHSQSHEFLNY